MSMELFVGGPFDGEVHDVDTRVPYWKMVDRPKFKPGAVPMDAVMKVLPYRQEVFGHRLIYVLESMPAHAVIDALLNNYKPQR